MSQQAIKLEMLGRTDSSPDKNEYYFTRPNMPCLVDLSQCVIFVHPYERPNGEFGAELVIKTYYPPGRRQGPKTRG